MTCVFVGRQVAEGAARRFRPSRARRALWHGLPVDHPESAERDPRDECRYMIARKGQQLVRSAVVERDLTPIRGPDGRRDFTRVRESLCLAAFDPDEVDI